MKKIFASALIATMSLTASADTGRASYDLQDKAYQTYRLISDSAHRLNARQIERINQLLNEVQGEVYGELPSARFLLKGSIERSEFTFEVRSLAEAYDHCTAFASKNGLTSSVDEINLSVNLGQIRRITTNGYWHSISETCLKLVEAAQEGGLNRVGARGVLVGNIERQDFKFIGHDRIELFRQCETFVNQNGLTRSVDEILVSRDFQKAEKKATPGYWNGALEICQQVIGQN